MGKWVAGILATIISSVVVYWLTIGFDQLPPNMPRTGSNLDDQDSRIAALTIQGVLETNRSGTSTSWQNPNSGHTGSVTPTRTYQASNGQYCREYKQTVTISGKTLKSYGTACRQPDGSWQSQDNPPPTNYDIKNYPNTFVVGDDGHKITVNTTDISDYFVVKDFSLTPGFAQAPSTVQFLLNAKGGFAGTVYIVFYDKDRVKITCSSSFADRASYLNCYDYTSVVRFSNKKEVDTLNAIYAWDQNEAQRAGIYINPSVSEIKFGFLQVK